MTFKTQTACGLIIGNVSVKLLEISSLVQELQHSPDLFGHYWPTLTLTFEPMTFSMSSVSSVPVSD